MSRATPRRTWPQIQAQFEAHRPPATDAETWIISELPQLPTRVKNCLRRLGVKYSGDLRYVTAAELGREQGMFKGSVAILEGICKDWKIPMGELAESPADASQRGAVSIPGTENRARRKDDQPEAVNRPAHYTPGPYEVYKVIAHFNIMHGFIQQAIIYLARAHRKGSYQQDVAKAAKWLEYTLETGAGVLDPLPRRTWLMNNRTIGDIAACEWGANSEIVSVIELLAEPWTDNDPSSPMLAHYVPQIFQALQLLRGEGK